MQEGWTLIITRPGAEAERLAGHAERAGLRSLRLPVLEIHRPPPTEEARAAVARFHAGEFGWIVCSSVNGVRCWHELQMEVGGSAGVPAGTRIAAVGEATAAACSAFWGRMPDCLPKRAEGSDLGRALIEAVSRISGEGRSPATVLYPSAGETSGGLEQELKAGGVELTQIKVYETRQVQPPGEVLEELRRLRPARCIYAFFSPSAVRATLAAVAKRSQLESARVACIGRVTASAANDAGLRVDCEASRASDEVLIAELCAMLRKWGD